METWDKSDVGKILIQKDQIFAILSVDSRVPNTVGFVEYPIAFNPKLGYMGLAKDREKKNIKDINELGDWYLLGKVSKEEMEDLERIANAPKVLSHEDLSPLSTFR